MQFEKYARSLAQFISDLESAKVGILPTLPPGIHILWDLARNLPDKAVEQVMQKNGTPDIRSIIEKACDNYTTAERKKARYCKAG